MTDFSLMDAIECGIVKLPRVPIADNIPGEEVPVFRTLWEHIRTKMPKKGRGKSGALDPLSLPVKLQTALVNTRLRRQTLQPTPPPVRGGTRRACDTLQRIAPAELCR